MKKRLFVVRLAAVAGAMGVGVIGMPAIASQRVGPAIDHSTRRAAIEAFERMPLLFVPEQVSADGAPAYAVRGRETSVWLTASGLTYSFHPTDAGKKGATAPRWVVALDLVGAGPLSLVAEDPLPARISYFKGPKTEWRAGLPTFGSVKYREPWPGVDLVVSGTAGELKSSFVVRPGTDPGVIRLAYRGASTVRLGPDGSLVVETPLGDIREEAPVAYQEVDGRRVDVPVAFELDGGTAEGREAYHFRLGEYDSRHELVVDPVTLVSCGYIGGLGDEYGDDIAVDTAGNMYISGITSSSEATFPVTVGPDLTYNGNSDVFVAKVNADGSALVYCGYIGGSENDGGGFLAIDTDGNAYVSGYTNSDETTFPVNIGPDLTYNGSKDAFVAKLDATGTTLSYCGYIGGDAGEEAYGVAVDAAGNAYVSGLTFSNEATFPVVVGPDLTFNGSGDAFVAKVTGTGDALSYCGYIGGSNLDRGYGIAVSAAGSAYLTGQTRSTETSFPVTVGPDLDFNGGTWDAFVAKVNDSGNALSYCGYIGGSGDDVGWAIAAGVGGNAYVTGETPSTEASFPVAVGPDLTYNGGSRDAFVAKVNKSGTALSYCGYIGGSSNDAAYGIAVGAGGDAYVTGVTASSEASFPVAIGPDLTYNNGGDAFVAEVTNSGTVLFYCGYIGGSSRDAGYGIAVDAGGNTYVTGVTASSEASFPVTVGPDLTYNGGAHDGFVAKVSSLGSLIFADGFESGNTSAWSATVP